MFMYFAVPRRVELDIDFRADNASISIQCGKSYVPARANFTTIPHCAPTVIPWEVGAFCI